MAETDPQVIVFPAAEIFPAGFKVRSPELVAIDPVVTDPVKASRDRSTSDYLSCRVDMSSGIQS